MFLEARIKKTMILEKKATEKKTLSKTYRKHLFQLKMFDVE